MADCLDDRFQFFRRVVAPALDDGKREFLSQPFGLRQLAAAFGFERDDFAHPRLGESELEGEALMLDALVSVTHRRGD